jgi:heat shock protein HslJ
MKRLSTLLLAGLLAGCMAPPPAPPAPYLAHGTQPSWSLIIDAQHVTFIGEDQTLLRDQSPLPVITAAGSTYLSPRIRVTIVHAQCRDGESQRIYPDRVRVDVDGQAFHGCGGR